MRYKRDDKVYVWCFSLETGKLIYDSYTIGYYEYMDGPQWNIVDEYILTKSYTKTKWGFIKSTDTITIRRPGHIISHDITLAKLSFLYHFLDLYNFKPNVHSDEMIKMIEIAKEEYNYYMINFPELIIKASKPKITENNNISYCN